ncbi:MAG: DUF4215 domain-containing protein [Nanoarchaeota archaeon]
MMKNWKAWGFFVLLIFLVAVFFFSYYPPEYLISERLQDFLSPSSDSVKNLKLYPVLTTPFTAYSSTIYLINIQTPSTPILGGKTVISGNEATDYFSRRLHESGTYNILVSLSLASQGTNSFTPLHPISGRKVNGLFDFVVDLSSFSDGLYTLRIDIEDPDTGVRGTLDEQVIIDNQDQTGEPEGILQTNNKCKCKKASIDTDNLYHNVNLFPYERGGSFALDLPVKNPKTGVIEPGFVVGTGFSTRFEVEGDPALCKPEGQGVRSSEIIPENGVYVRYGLDGSTAAPTFVRDGGRHQITFPPSGDMSNHADDNYKSPVDNGLKSYVYSSDGGNNQQIIMTDIPKRAASYLAYPQGYERIDQFLSEVEDSHAGADGIKRKCRCKFDHIMSSTSGSGRVIEKRCVAEVPVTCGNRVVDIGEQCDDGNADETDACGLDCKLTICGDGTIQSPNGNGLAEECDDENTNNYDRCSNTCTLTICGDGMIQSPNGHGFTEQCESDNDCSIRFPNNPTSLFCEQCNCFSPDVG